jgi:hypothetical protein
VAIIVFGTRHALLYESSHGGARRWSGASRVLRLHADRVLQQRIHGLLERPTVVRRLISVEPGAGMEAE